MATYLTKTNQLVMKILGIILVIIGAGMLIFTGFEYVTKETIVDIGPINIEADKTNYVALSPILGALLLIGGVVILVLDRRK